MDTLVLIAVLGGVGLVTGLLLLAWLRSRPDLRRWAPFALVVAVGSATVLGLALLPPVALWLMLGAP